MIRPGFLRNSLLFLPCAWALLLPSASLHPLELLRQVRVRLSAALFHVKLLGVTDGGGLLTWPRVQQGGAFEHHATPASHIR